MSAFALQQGTRIIGVQAVPTKNPSVTRTVVQMSDNSEWSTIKPDVASKAVAFRDNPNVTIMVSINGNFKNFDDVIPGSGAAPAQAPPQQIQAAAHASGAPDAKDLRISRGNAINAAAAVLGPLVGTGVWLSEDGELDEAAVAAHVIAVARGLAPYIIEGPKSEAASEVPALPPGATAEQAAQWANAQSGESVVQLGAPVAPPTPEAPASAY